MAGSHVQAAWSGEISVVGEADRVCDGGEGGEGDECSLVITAVSSDIEAENLS